MFVSSQYSYDEILTLPANVIVGGGAFGKKLGQSLRGWD